MINGNVTVDVSQDRTRQLLESLKALSKVDVLVGIPEENNSRPGEEITNSELGFIQDRGIRSLPMRQEMDQTMRDGTSYTKAHEMYLLEHGSDLWHAPPRPILVPAIEDPENQATIVPELSQAAKCALENDKEGMNAALVRAGMQGQNVVRDWFTNPKNNWAPNSPITIKKKGSDNPLIDKGELRKAVSFVVREKGE